MNLQSYAPPLCAKIILPRKIGFDNNFCMKLIDDNFDYTQNEYKLNYNYEYKDLHHLLLDVVYLQHQKQKVYFHQVVNQFLELVHNKNEYLNHLKNLLFNNIIDK